MLIRAHLLPLGKLVSLEMGKIVPEGVGEVQVSEVDRGMTFSRKHAFNTVIPFLV